MPCLHPFTIRNLGRRIAFGSIFGGAVGAGLLQRIEIFVPLMRQQILLLTVAFLAAGYNIRFLR